jgi:hypothetical protein
MDNTNGYSPSVVKMANFAKNAASWQKQEGGEFESHVMYKGDASQEANSYQQHLNLKELGYINKAQTGVETTAEKTAAQDFYNNTGVVKRKDTTTLSPNYINPVAFESNNNFSIGKALAVLDGGVKDMFSGKQDENGVKAGSFRDWKKKGEIQKENKGDYYNYETKIDTKDPNIYGANNIDLFNASKLFNSEDLHAFTDEEKSMIPTGDNGQPEQGMTTEFKHGGPLPKAQWAGEITMQEWFMEDPVGRSGANAPQEFEAFQAQNNESPFSTTNQANASETPELATPEFNKPEVNRTNPVQGGVDRLMDSKGMTAFGDVSNFAVQGAGVINDWFRDKKVNDARVSNRENLMADNIYGVNEDPFMKRGAWDVNTGTFGSEAQRTVELNMGTAQRGKEISSETIDVDSTLLAKLIAAGADIEIL